MKMYPIGTGVGVLIKKDNKILLGLRNDDPEKADTELHLEGTWTMPGGKMEYGESFEEAAFRETKEETSLEIIDPKVICVSNDKNEHAHFVTIGLYSEKYKGEVKTMEPDEIIKWEWFDLNNLPENLYFPSKIVLNNYLNGTFYKKEEQK